MKLITENINVSPDENDIIDELTSIIGKWGDNVEKQDILNLINNYIGNKSLDETVTGVGQVNLGSINEGGSTSKEADVLEDGMFFLMVKMLVEYMDESEWSTLIDGYNMYDRVEKINKVTKLFGKQLYDSHPSSMVNKLFWAVIDNHEDIVSGEIDEFKYLTVRPLKTFSMSLLEYMEETNRYDWEVIINGYDEWDTREFVVDNADGDFDPWANNSDYDYDKEHTNTHRQGMDIVSMEEETITESTNLNEESSIPSAEVNDVANVGEDYVIGRIDAAIMDRIVRDYSVTEIQLFNKKMWFDLELLDDTLKMFGKKGDDGKLVKKYVQFIWDNGVPENFTPFIGQKLPRMKKFKFTYRWEREEIESFNGDIIVYGTDYETTLCDVKSDMWEYEMQDIRSTGILREDDDLYELMSASVDGSGVFNNVTPDKWDKKYDTRNPC